MSTVGDTRPGIRSRAIRRIALLLLVPLALGLGCASSEISRLAERGDAEGVRRALAAGADPNAPDYKKRTPVEVAVLVNKPDVLRELIKGGAALDRLGHGHRMPIHWAAMRPGSEFVLQELIEAGANVNGLDVLGQPPLLYAIIWGSDDQLKRLLDAGADPSVYMEKKWRSELLFVAYRYKKLEKMTLLVAAGANPDAPNARGESVSELTKRNRTYWSAIEKGRKLRAGSTYAAASPDPRAGRASRQTISVTRPVASRPPSTPVPVAPAPPPVPKGDVSGAAWGRYYALVIGNDAYRHLPKLQTAVADAQAVSTLLEREYGFEVELLRDATRAEILRSLSKYRKTLRAEDNLLIYYAGHGWLDRDADNGYWLPVDATDENEIYWISNNFITSSTRAMNAKHVMVIADSCYSGKLTRGLLIRNRKPGYLERLASLKARVVMTSGGLEPVLDAGGNDGHSVFASALLRALRANQGVMEGHELFDQVRRPVAVNSDQMPEYADIRKAGHDGGDFLFIRP